MNVFKILACGLFLTHAVLTGQQIEKLSPNIKNLIKKSGMSDSQINKVINKEMDKMRTSEKQNTILPNSMIEKDKILDDVEKVEKSNQSVNDKIEENLVFTFQKENDLSEQLSFDEKNTTDSSGIQFGYNIFKNNPGLFDESVKGAIDPNYTIGPGDEIVIMLWGETELQNSYLVSAQGYIFVDNLGQIFVNGLNLEKLEKKLFRLLKKSMLVLTRIMVMLILFLMSV